MTGSPGGSNSLRTRIAYYFNPPEEAIFQPTEQTMLETHRGADHESLPGAAHADEDRHPAPRVPPPTRTDHPDAPARDGDAGGRKYEHQHSRYNYCGPANFSMALTFWGWDGNRDVIGKAVMPGNTTSEGKAFDKDKNVMPYELQNYIAENVTYLSSLLRYGGNIDLLKRMVSAGFPVVVEKGIYEMDLNGKVGWMGHYAFVTGYDDAKQEIIYQDTYQPPGAPPGKNRRLSYAKFIEGWRAFNYVFVVVYPYEREAQVLTLLGDWADDEWATQHALAIAENESRTLTRHRPVFCLVQQRHQSRVPGESRLLECGAGVRLRLRAVCETGGDDSIRPYRMMWYQTGPYKAYFFIGRYADVINLATTHARGHHQ